MTGTFPNYSINVGTIDGLGLTAPASNVAVTPVTGGQLWYSSIKVTMTFTTAGAGTLSAQVTSNYTHSSGPRYLLLSHWCVQFLISHSCDDIISYSLHRPQQCLEWRGYLGTLLQSANGASAFTGADSVTVTFTVASTGATASCALTINLVAQDALKFTLATSGSGLTISPASDFSAAWGSVNGLGVGTPSSGLTIHSAAGGAVYETPINLLPVYSSFSSTTCTLSVYVSSNFTHSSLFTLEDTGTFGGPYTTISLSSASPTSMTTTAASNATLTRYLAVFVSNLDGASAYSGADNATLTYQMTVP